MSRVVIIGNAGAGKSTLARKPAARRGLPHIEIDRLLWQEGWKTAPLAVYERQHAEAIAGGRWVIDGLGQRTTIPDRVARATEIILIDMPLWIHLWLAAERQIAWARGAIDHPPGGIAQMPPTERLFRAIWDVERDWMPAVRSLCEDAEERGIVVVRLTDVQAVDAFAAQL
jgi:adenylate kinase family enzyme